MAMSWHGTVASDVVGMSRLLADEVKVVEAHWELRGVVQNVLTDVLDVCKW